MIGQDRRREAFLERTYNWAALFGVALALVPVVVQLIGYFAEQSWTGSAVYLALLLFLGYLTWYIVPARRPPGAEPTTVFQPFIDVDKLNTWPRVTELDRLVAAACEYGPDRPLSVVVGPSAAGKTVLLRRLFKESVESMEANVLYFDTYQGIDTTLENAVQVARRTARHNAREIGPGRDNVLAGAIIVILDQFEQFLAMCSEKDRVERARLRSWLLDFIGESARSTEVHFICGVRREWYYELRFLGGLVPPPSGCVHVDPPTRRDSHDTYHTIVAKFEQVVDNKKVAAALVRELEHSGHLVPLEVQIVGSTIEQAARQGRTIGSDFLHGGGGPAGAVHEFFEQLLREAPSRRVATKVLFALAVRTRFRRQEKLRNILDALYEHPTEVRAATDYLCRRGLVVERELARYELAHDYLAEYFHHLAGRELNPTDRDNIQYHLDSPASAETDPPFVQRLSKSARAEGRGHFAHYVIGPLLVLMLIRLVGGVDWIAGTSPLAQAPLLGKFLDASYVPIFVAHGAWALYVFRFYQGVLVNLKEPSWHRLASYLTVLNMAACVLVAMRWPEVWVLSIGWGGMVIGLRVLMVSRREGMNPIARSLIRGMGARTVANMVFVIIGGFALVLLSHRLVHGPGDLTIWSLVSVVLSMMLTYFCLIVWPTHVGDAAASRIISMLARSGSLAVPRIDP